jgi:hypothetical protein
MRSSTLSGIFPVGKHDEIERRQRLAAHGVDVADRVRGGDTAKRKRVVDHRRKEVDRSDDRQPAAHAIDARVVVRVGADEHVRISDRRQLCQHAREIPRPYLRGAPTRRHFLGERHLGERIAVVAFLGS